MLSNTGEKFAAGNAFVSGDWRSSRWCTVEVSSHRLGSNAFDNLIWPHFDTYNWPHLINKDAGPVRQKSYGPSRDGVQRKGRRLSPFLCTSNVEDLCGRYAQRVSDYARRLAGSRLGLRPHDYGGGP